MRTLLNIIWVITGGIWLSLGYFFFGLLACVLVVTLPAGGAGWIGRGRVVHTWRVLSMTSDHHAAGPGPVDATRRW